MIAVTALVCGVAGAVVGGLIGGPAFAVVGALIYANVGVIVVGWLTATSRPPEWDDSWDEIEWVNG